MTAWDETESKIQNLKVHLSPTFATSIEKLPARGVPSRAMGCRGRVGSSLTRRNLPLALCTVPIHFWVGTDFGALEMGTSISCEILRGPHEKNSRMTEAFLCKHLYHCYITTIIIILGCFSTLTRMSKISQEGLEGFARSLLIHKAMMEIKESSRSEK